jgi:hypothetical protein
MADADDRLVLPERLPGKPRLIRTDIAVLFVGDEAEKQALLLGEPEVFFTTPGYDLLPLVVSNARGRAGSTRTGPRSSQR